MKTNPCPLYAALILKSFVPDGRVWRLMGPDNAQKRQQLASQLQGRFVPKASSGCTAINSLVYDLLGIIPANRPELGQFYGCTAGEENFIEWLLAGI